MVHGKYKKVLWEIFDVLGFLENEKEMALEGFKKKFANELLSKVQGALSEDQRQWIAQAVAKKEYDKNDPNFNAIQKTIELAYSKEEFDKISGSVFKKILVSYVDFMSQKIDAQKAKKIQEIESSF